MAKLLVFIAIVGQFFCGLASVTANSRMIYAFSRDGALPGSKFWHKINPKTRTPTNSVWLGVTLSALVGTLSLYQKGGYSTAFFALTGICVIGLYIAYAIPIYLRLTNPDFEVGPVEPEGAPQARRLDGARLDRVHLDPVLRSAVLAVLGRSGTTVRRVPTPSFFKQNNFNFTGPLILIAAVFVLGLLELQRQEVVHRARRCRAPRRSCWPSSASSTPWSTARRSEQLATRVDGSASGPARFASALTEAAASVSHCSNLGRAARRSQLPRRSCGVADEVGVERADRLLHHRPHALAELAHHLHQLQARPT